VRIVFTAMPCNTMFIPWDAGIQVHIYLA
jgi:hypothetical protein